MPYPFSKPGLYREFGNEDHLMDAALTRYSTPVVKDANPDWGIQTGPTWSPDFEWFLMWDGTRLFLTTVDDPATTRVLASESSGGAYNYDVPTFSITERDYSGN